MTIYTEMLYAYASVSPIIFVIMMIISFIMTSLPEVDS